MNEISKNKTYGSLLKHRRVFPISRRGDVDILSVKSSLLAGLAVIRDPIEHDFIDVYHTLDCI